MTLKAKINQLRRAMMRSLTSGIGNSSSTNQGIINPAEVKSVLISRPNHRLGNLLLITPLVQEVQTLFPKATIDIFIKGNLGPIVFENYSSVGQIIRLPKKHFDEKINYIKGWWQLKSNTYDLAINAEKNSSSGRLSIQLAKATYKCFGETEMDLSSQYPDYTHISKYPIYDLRNFLSTHGMKVPDAPVSNLLLKLSEKEINTGKALLDAIVPSSRKTICIFTFATGAKCYSKAWWGVFYEHIIKEFPDYNVLEVLPVENVSQIDFKAPTYYSKDVREIAAFFKSTSVFVGADSGMMHLAAAAQIPVVGLFSVTNPDRYKPYGEKSVAINTNETVIEDWIQAIKDSL